MERRLKALGYPNAENFDPNDVQQYRHLVVWLENNKIRNYDVKKREDLMAVNDDNKWNSAFMRYLNDQQCPLDWFDVGGGINSAGHLSWLLGHAVRAEYFVKEGEYNHQTKSFVAVKGSTAANGDEPKKKRFSTNPLENMDYQSQEFKDGVEQLSQQLLVPHHADHLVTLEACSKLIQKRLNAKSLKDPSKVVGNGEPFSLADHSMGFGDSIYGHNDPVLKEAAKILRLIHLTNLRELQSSINNTIEAVQRVTANPKTDTKLGKVGF